MLFWGILRPDRMALTVAAGGAFVGTAAYFTYWQVWAGVKPGYILIGLAFGFLLAGFLNSLYGDLLLARLKRLWWWLGAREGIP